MQVKETAETFFKDQTSCNIHLSQPVYNHPEYVSAVENRADYEKKLLLIFEIIDNYINQTKKEKVKILDLGCALGYIDFRIREKFGKKVSITGYDFHKPSVDLAKAVNEEKHWDIDFRYGDEHKENPVSAVASAEYDIVFLFNFLKETSVCDGRKSWLEELAAKTDFLLLEAEESADADDIKSSGVHDSWFDNISYYGKMALSPYSADGKQEVFCFASDRYVYFKNVFYRIDKYKNSLSGMRRAFLSGDTLLKFVYKKIKCPDFDVYPEGCINELCNEGEVCRLGMSFTPDVLYMGDEDGVFVSVLKLKNTGVSEVNFDFEQKENSVKKIINILDNLIECENQGLYHYDLTLWNVMEDAEGKAFLIDAGALTKINKIEGGNSLLKNLLGRDDEFTSYDAFVTLVWTLFPFNRKKYQEYRSVNILVPYVFFDGADIPPEFYNFFKKYQTLKKRRNYV